MTGFPAEARTRPRPRLRDHLRVLGLLLQTLAGVVPFVLHVLVAPVATPIARGRLRRLLAEPAEGPETPPPVDPAAWAGKSLFVVAGEPSGDRLAARVVGEIRRQAPDVRIRGYAGPAVAAAGAVLDRSIVEHAVVGFTAVVATLPTWWRLCAEALAIFREDPPDALLTIDFPGLNLRLARWARRAGIRTVHLVAPQTWAWAPWRTGRLRRAVSLLLVTFPFEPRVFRAAGVRAAYVGHPLFEAPLPPPSSPDAPPSAAPLVELRPGSRRREVRRQGPIVLEAARAIARRVPDARFLVRLASERGRATFDAVLARHGPLPERHELRLGRGAEEAPVAVALTTSGTSTAELAAALVPMVVFYRVSMLARLGARLLVTSPYVAMANLLAGREIVPERLVPAGGGAALGDEVAGLLADRDRWLRMRGDLATVRARLAHPDVAARAASFVLSG